MIEAQGLSKVFADYIAVSNVTFTAKKGEIVGFLGPNGAGKTTTIRMLSTFTPPSAGKATICGLDIEKDAAEVRRLIGYLPENPPLYGEMTVEEYLRFVAEIKGLVGATRAPAIKRVIDQCILGDVRHKLCRHLSRGYRQRVGIAQAIIHDPEVIILDEPTSGLDPKQIMEIRALIKSLGANKTLLLSTHILPEVSMICSKVVVVNRGRTVLESALAELPQGKSLEEIFIQCIGSEAAMQDMCA